MSSTNSQETESGPGTSTEPLPSLSGVAPAGMDPKIVSLSRRFAEVAQEHRTGLYMAEDHRYWWNGQGPYPSVTSALKVLHKEAVVQWMARETARGAWAHRLELPSSEEECVSFLINLPREKTDTAATLGTDIHRIADLYARSPQDGLEAFPLTDVQLSFAKAFLGFLGHYTASEGRDPVISSEHAVFNLSDGWAGTFDLVISIGGENWLIDLKTSKGYYPEYGLQLAAYRHAEFIGLPNDPTRYVFPEIHRTAVLHLRPDAYPDTGWRLVEYPTTDRDYMAFLAALDLWQWKAEGRFTKKKLNG